MANNFEIVLPRENYISTDKGVLNEQTIIGILNSHNCKWLLAPHPIDDNSSFMHWHIGIHTDSDNTYDTIAKWFGLATHCVNGVKKRFDTTYALYLIHYGHDDKSDIPIELIQSNFDINYDRLIGNIENKKHDDDILDALSRGDITEHQLYSQQSEQWCRKHLKQINDALIVRSKKYMAKQEERNMEVVYITGNARCGKSYLARKLSSTNGQSLYETSNGEHPFDDYMGQDAVLLDDIRPSNFKFSELLRILDNHMSSKVSARYHNVDLNCKVLYLTSTLPLESFYSNLLESHGEASEQLRGRIGTYIKVTKEKVEISVYESSTNGYKLISTIPNPILTDKNVDLLDTDKRKQMAIQLFQGVADLSQYAADRLTEQGNLDGSLQMTIDDWQHNEDTDNPFN